VGHSIIAELLAKVGLLDERQVDAVMSRSGSGSGGHVVLQVAEMGYASESAVARAISIELGLPRIDLALTPPEPDALQLLDGRVCMDRLVLPVALRENGELLWLAMADPTDSEAVTFVRRKTNKRVRPAVAGPTEIIRTARQAYGVQMPRQSSARGEEELGAIDISEVSGESEPIEVVNVMDESASPLARIARQLGVQMPPVRPATADVPDVPDDRTAADAAATEMHPGHARRAPPPPPFGKKTPPPPVPSAAEADQEVELVDPINTGPIIADPNREDLTSEELVTLEAIRESMEKSAHVLRTVVALCLEKGLFTKDDMTRRRKDQDGH
jgi:hypothetical protein